MDQHLIYQIMAIFWYLFLGACVLSLVVAIRVAQLNRSFDKSPPRQRPMEKSMNKYLSDLGTKLGRRWAARRRRSSSPR